MASARRIGAEDSKTRAALLDAAERLLLEEGQGAVTSRRIAAAAGVKPPLVHYYFRTMDDLVLAVLRRGAEANLARQAAALASPDPLRAVWEQSADPTATAVSIELMAMARRRPAIRAEMAAYAERLRALQVEALRDVFAARGADLPPVVASVLMVAVSQLLVLEESLGVTTGHDEVLALVEEHLGRLEP
jgi:AcrR family transcriptional regulator